MPRHRPCKKPCLRCYGFLLSAGDGHSDHASVKVPLVSSGCKSNLFRIRRPGQFEIKVGHFTPSNFLLSCTINIGEHDSGFTRTPIESQKSEAFAVRRERDATR